LSETKKSPTPGLPPKETRISRFDSLLQSLKGHVSAYESFEKTGKNTVATVIRAFAAYLEAPPNTCRVGPPGVALDAEPTTPLDQVAELMEDGWFGATLLIHELSPPGVRMSLTFLARIDGDSTVLKLQHGDKEFRIKELTQDSLAPFIEHVFTTVMEQVSVEPWKLAAGAAKRPIGFT
jgi:hypothetical protein